MPASNLGCLSPRAMTLRGIVEDLFTEGFWCALTDAQRTRFHERALAGGDVWIDIGTDVLLLKDYLSARLN